MPTDCSSKPSFSFFIQRIFISFSLEFLIFFLLPDLHLKIHSKRKQNKKISTSEDVAVDTCRTATSWRLHRAVGKKPKERNEENWRPTDEDILGKRERERARRSCTWPFFPSSRQVSPLTQHNLAACAGRYKSKKERRPGGRGKDIPALVYSKRIIIRLMRGTRIMSGCCCNLNSPFPTEEKERLQERERERESNKRVSKMEGKDDWGGHLL